MWHNPSLMHLAETDVTVKVASVISGSVEASDVHVFKFSGNDCHFLLACFLIGQFIMERI